MFCFIFISIIIKINHLYLLSSSILHTFTIIAPCGYDVILSKVCNLLSSLLLSAILLISSVYTLCASLLSLCCDFDNISLFNKQSLKSLNLSLLFMTHFLVPLAWFLYHHLLNKNKSLV